MIYWMLEADVEHFDGIQLAPAKEAVDFTKRFIGKSLNAEWEVRSFWRYGENPLGDFPSLPSKSPPVFSHRAWTILTSLIERDVEALPVYIDQEKFYVINVLTINNCLDLDKSDYHLFPNGRLMYVNRPVFDPKCVGNHHMFKIRQLPSGPTFVSGTFRQAIIEHSLEGLLFPD